MDSECTTRNLAFCSILKIIHEVLDKDSTVVDFLLNSVCPVTPRIAVRLMKALKAFLCVANFGTFKDLI